MYKYSSPPLWAFLQAHPAIPPFLVVTEHRAELRVLRSSFPLAVYFTHGCVYVSVFIPQFTPPPPFQVSVSVFYVCASIPALQMSTQVSALTELVME